MRVFIIVNVVHVTAAKVRNQGIKEVHAWYILFFCSKCMAATTDYLLLESTNPSWNTFILLECMSVK